MADWVIVVDDDKENLKIAGHVLSKKGMRVTALKSGILLIDYVKEYGLPDIILLDILMPDMDGFETLIRLRETETEIGASETPVVFLTADEDSANEMRGFKMGVSDFIHKPFDPGIFAQRIANIIASNRKMHSIEEKASRDVLTGFYNKEHTRIQITGMCLKEGGSLCMIDIDSFKLVNDIYGHDMGDRMLIRFAAILNENMTPGSVCGRIGGDEFLMFGLNMKREGDIADFVGRLNERIVQAAEELMGHDMRIPIGVSVGAVSVPKQGTDYDELFSMADKALYTVKDNGKHGYALYHGEHMTGLIDENTDHMDLKTLSKILEERGIPQNVMWMGKEAFGNVYRYMMRYLERYDIPAYKVLFTINYRDKDIIEENREQTADSLKEIIQTSLRNSDIMVRIGTDQFFLLLPELDSENVDGVLDRMNSAWERSPYAKVAALNCEYESV